MIIKKENYERIGYEVREDRDSTVIFIYKKTGKMFYGEEKVIQNIFNKLFNYANRKMLGHDIHNLLS